MSDNLIIIYSEVKYMLVAVCDDDRTITDYIKLLIDTEFRDIIQTKIYDSASDLESSILKNEIPDAIIIDLSLIHI